MTGQSGYVSTHVLDAALGVPAAQMKIDLYRIEGDVRSLLWSMETNQDGRTDAPVIPSEEMRIGAYELLFHAGQYLDRIGAPGETPRFLDLIPIRFGVASTSAHYHVPLLLSPYSYSTYRGS